MHSFGPVNPNCMATCPAAAFGISIGTMNGDRKSTRLNSSHSQISYAVFCLKKKKKQDIIVLRVQVYIYDEYQKTVVQQQLLLRAVPCLQRLLSLTAHVAATPQHSPHFTVE